MRTLSYIDYVFFRNGWRLYRHIYGTIDQSQNPDDVQLRAFSPPEPRLRTLSRNGWPVHVCQNRAQSPVSIVGKLETVGDRSSVLVMRARRVNVTPLVLVIVYPESGDFPDWEGFACTTAGFGCAGTAPASCNGTSNVSSLYSYFLITHFVMYLNFPLCDPIQLRESLIRPRERSFTCTLFYRIHKATIFGLVIFERLKFHYQTRIRPIRIFTIS